LSPLQEFGFMRRAAVACVALGLSCGPVGVLLILRRMSLMGDALSHAILPGAAVGYVFLGLSLPALSVGALVAGLLVALGAGAVSRFTPQREDASFAAFYLIALAGGVMLIAVNGTQVDLLHVLFGSVLAVDDQALLLLAGIATFTLLTLAVLWRPLIADSVEPGFLRGMASNASRWPLLFLPLVVLNLVGAFQAMGTLMAVGLMMLPAAAARFWAVRVPIQCSLAAIIGAVSGLAGLLLSYYRDWPSGPSIVLCAGGIYLASVLVGPQGGVLSRRHALFVATMAVALWVAPHGATAQGQQQPAAAPTPLKVITSFSILADLAREVGGDAITVESLVGPDEDAHVFEPTPKAARQMANADIVLVNGLHFEGWLDRLIKASGFKGPVVVASNGITALKLDGDIDPHAWQDIANARRFVANISAALTQQRPAQADVFKQRAHIYDEKLQALDQHLRSQFAALPPAQRRVITSHDAFGYFANAYGIEFLAPQGWSTDKEATAAQVGRLIRQLKTQQVRAVFIENMGNPKLAQRLAAEGAAVLGGTLYPDALAKPGQGPQTYLELMQHNADALEAALRR
jgi:zinc/manganese transport system permease protein